MCDNMTLTTPVYTVRMLCFGCSGQSCGAAPHCDEEMTTGLCCEHAATCPCGFLLLGDMMMDACCPFHYPKVSAILSSFFDCY